MDNIQCRGVVHAEMGVAFAIFTLSYTLSTSMVIVIYFQIWINAVRVVVNIPIIIYLFRELLNGKLK
jgi:hypothetical protein